MLPPIAWLPSPNYNLRDARYPLRGVVSHRIVGTLTSAKDRFLNPKGGASSHFGLGYVNGILTIHQYVDLADMAWTNGDVREPTWTFYQPGVNPNLTTVTIEHEDGGTANRGKVSEEVWAVSMALQKLITSGDRNAIRAAGIRVRHDHIVTQLAAIPKDERGFIDHHQIAGPNKPYCFRRWLDDPGFVEGSPSRRDRLLAFLNGDDMQALKGAEPVANRRAVIGGEATIRSTPAFDRNNYDSNVITRTDPTGSGAPIIAWVQGTNLTLNDGTVFDPRTRWAALLGRNYGIGFVHERDVVRLEAIEQIVSTESFVALQQQAVTALKNIAVRANADAEALQAKKP